LDPDLEIEFDEAEKSIEFDRGLAAHFQASANEKQRLLDIARAEHEQAENYRQLYLQEHAKNQRLEAENKRLEAENAQFRARPQYEIQNYIEQQKVARQYVSIPLHKKSKKQIYNPNQLPLWDPNVSYT